MDNWPINLESLPPAASNCWLVKVKLKHFDILQKQILTNNVDSFSKAINVFIASNAMLSTTLLRGSISHRVPDLLADCGWLYYQKYYNDQIVIVIVCDTHAISALSDTYHYTSRKYDNTQVNTRPDQTSLLLSSHYCRSLVQ